MIRWYFVEEVIYNGYAVPKYIGPNADDWGGLQYGNEGVFLAWADVTDEEHTQLTNLQDVLALPANIDNYLTPGVVPIAQAFLEFLFIPAHWVSTDYTYRQIMRVIAGVFMFSQRFYAMHATGLKVGSVTLDTQWQNLPSLGRTRFLETALDMGFSTEGFTNQSTVKEILQALGLAWLNTTFIVGGLEL